MVQIFDPRSWIRERSHKGYVANLEDDDRSIQPFGEMVQTSLSIRVLGRVRAGLAALACAVLVCSVLVGCVPSSTPSAASSAVPSAASSAAPSASPSSTSPVASSSAPESQQQAN